MHQAQRKALYAMIDAVENQVRYIKSILMMEDDQPAVKATPKAAPRSAQSEYLGDEEEDKLSEEIEAARQESLEEERELQEQWRKQRQIIVEETTL